MKWNFPNFSSAEGLYKQFSTQGRFDKSELISKKKKIIKKFSDCMGNLIFEKIDIFVSFLKANGSKSALKLLLDES